MPVKDYNADPNLNTQISDINIAEGCAPSGINNAIRQLMADVKVEFESEEGAVPALDSTLRALIAEEVAKCLKTSGGTLTGVVRQSIGDIITAARDDMWTSIKGGSEHNHGAALTLYGQDHGGSGHAELLAYKEGVGAATLNLSPTGVAIISGNAVLTSAGGTITGSLHLSNILSGDNDGIELYGGNAWRTGGYIELGGPNHTLPNHVQINGGSRQVLEDLGSGWHIAGSPIVTLVASWRGGNDWYRKYSDGWIEQGGYIWLSGSGTHAVSLNTPFTNTVYTVVTSQADLGSSGGEWVNGQAITGRTTTSFNVYDVHSGGHTILWYACGY